MARGASSTLASPLARRRRADVAVPASAAVLLLLLLAIFVVWPVVRLLAAGLGRAGATLGRDAVRTLLDTLQLATVSTVVTVAVALVLAYAVTRADIAGRRFVSLVSRLPLVAPPFLAALALVLLFGRDGLVRQWLGLAWSIEGLAGLVLAQVITFLPQAYVVLARALAGIDPALEEAAENLGARRLTTLRRVTLPLAQPGLASAALVVFLLCMADFGNPMLVGGRFTVLTTAIYAQAVTTKDVTAAATLSVALLIPCLAVYLVDTYWIRSRAPGPAPIGERATPRASPRALRAALFVVSAGTALVLAVVAALVPLGSLLSRQGGEWSLSLEHYRFTAGPIWNSLRLALLAAALGTVLALVTAWVTVRRRLPGARLLGVLSLLPAALPGVLVGLGYVLAFSTPPLPLAGTVWILVASVVFWRLPIAVRAATSVLGRIDPAVEEAALSLGAGGVRTFARIVLPLLASTAASIFVSFFVSGLVTVSAVIFLTFPGFDLASVAIIGQVAHGSSGAACALATGLLALALGAVALLRALVGSDRVVIVKP
jgi:iron(III) transport system permease protein